MPKIANWLTPYIDAISSLSNWFGLSPVVDEIVYGYIGGMSEAQFKSRMSSVNSALAYLTSLINKAAREAGEKLANREGNYPPAISDVIANVINSDRKKARQKYSESLDSIDKIERAVGEAQNLATSLEYAGRNFATTRAGSKMLDQVDSIVSSVEGKIGNKPNKQGGTT